MHIWSYIYISIYTYIIQFIYTCRQIDNSNPTQCCFSKLTQPPSSDRGHATLHIVVAATHCFDKTVTETVIQVPRWPCLSYDFSCFSLGCEWKGGPPEISWQSLRCFFFPTCQVRVVRFYVSCLLLLPPPASCLLLVLLVVLVVLVQLRPAIHSVRCRTSTTTIHDQCSLPDLNHDQPRPVFPAGPQPRPATPSVPCRTSTVSIHAKCSLPDLM